LVIMVSSAPRSDWNPSRIGALENSKTDLMS
jgi:hypothetical protein